MAEFENLITAVNKTLDDYWPCSFCWYFSYIFAIITFGLSLLIPNVCIQDATENLQAVIVRANKKFKTRVDIQLVKYYGSSWL